MKYKTKIVEWICDGCKHIVKTPDGKEPRFNFVHPLGEGLECPRCGRLGLHGHKWENL